MSIISFCILSLELDQQAPPVPSLNFLSQRFREMSEQGKGLPLSVPGDFTVVRGRRQARQYELQTYVPNPSGDQDHQVPQNSLADGAGTETKTFVSGNPSVEVTRGLLHLYKDNDRLFMEKASTSGRSEMLCILAVPASVSCNDLLNFVSAYRHVIEHIQIIRDTQPNQYLVLLRFKSQLDADTFYKEFNGKKYNSFDDDVCLLAFVAKVENLKACDGAGLPLTGYSELPTCPVCLERMDESVDGLLTILCNHSFHSGCLAKWSDTSCPVCRYVQTPEMVAQNMCVECSSTDSLWICLICGHVGCGRYVHGHAFKHFCETKHSYAIQPDNNRVWDYIGDNFVHRLLQNKDGKLVESSRTGHPEGMDQPYDEEKIDSIQLEFTNTLTHQLETQRKYFEENIEQCRKEYQAQIDELTSKVKALESLEQKLKESENRSSLLEKDKGVLEKKVTQLSQRISKLTMELKEEKEFSKVAYDNLKEYQDKYNKREREYEEASKAKAAEIQDLQDQVRDLMFYFEAQKKIEESPELAGGSVGVQEQQQKQSSKGRRKKN